MSINDFANAIQFKPPTTFIENLRKRPNKDLDENTRVKSWYGAGLDILGDAAPYGNGISAHGTGPAPFGVIQTHGSALTPFGVGQTYENATAPFGVSQ